MRQVSFTKIPIVRFVREGGNVLIQELLFTLPDGRKLFVRSTVLKKILPYQQHKPDDLEGGGILIGRILEENDHFIIDDASEPMPQDIRKRTRFTRNPQGHQAYYDTIWKRAGGRCFYLGEWHTHPERNPTPSNVDKRDWKRIIQLKHESDALFFIIIGTNRVRVWYGDRKEMHIIGLN